VKIWRTLSLLGTVLAALGTAAGQRPNTLATQPGTSLTISALQDSVKTGSPVRVRVTLKNRSNHDVVVATEVSGLDCQVEVRGADGRLAADTKLGYIWNGHVASPDTSRISPQDLNGNAIFTTLNAGKTLTWELDAARLYDMRQPGKFTIQVQKRDPENASILLKSNRVAVTVTP
jgi:hypothetical protein